MNYRSFLWLLTLTVWAQQQPEKTPRLILGEETPVQLRLLETVSSEDAEVNQQVVFEVAEDVRVDDRIVIPRGSHAWGVVTATARKSRLRRNGKLDIDLQAVCLPTGKPAPLRAMRRGARRPDGADVATTDSLFALPALPVMLFVWGKDVTIQEGSEFTTYLAEDTVVPLNDRAPDAAKACPVSQPAPVEMMLAAKSRDDLSTVNVNSNPPNAEIYVDDKYMGTTPAVLKLPAGEHQIRLVAAGRPRWERLMAVTPGGEANIQATIESAVMVQKQ